MPSWIFGLDFWCLQPAVFQWASNFRDSDRSHFLSPSSVLSTEITVCVISNPCATQLINNGAGNHTQACGAPQPNPSHIQPAWLCCDLAAKCKGKEESQVSVYFLSGNKQTRPAYFSGRESIFPSGFVSLKLNGKHLNLDNLYALSGAASLWHGVRGITKRIGIFKKSWSLWFPFTKLRSESWFYEQLCSGFTLQLFCTLL